MIYFNINIYKLENVSKMANIKSNNYRKIDCRIINDMYMDFMISKEEIAFPVTKEDCVAASLNFNNAGKHIVSTVTWSGATTSDKKLQNIGFTGVDNGFITYKKDRIGNDEFLELFTNSSLDLSMFTDKFFVTQVSGNTGMFSYPTESCDKYTAFKGGFYQGFFKIAGDKYQTLPHTIDDEWHFNITLRPQEYDTQLSILNQHYPENKGIFFYIGTRAENKFWELYKRESSAEDYKREDADINDKLDNVPETQYQEGIIIPEKNDSDDVIREYDYAHTELIKYNFSELSICNNINTGDTKCCENNDYDCPSDGLIFDDEYIEEQYSLENVKLFDSKGFPIGEKGFYEIETDNKFVIFNQTNNGFTTKTWKPESKFILTGKTDTPNINYYPYLNHTNTGLTKNEIHKLAEAHSYAYDVFKDIENNALALKLNDDGSISYRYLSTACEIIEETTKPGLVKPNEWSNIHLKICHKSNKGSEICDKREMQLFIYVNGYLKLVSKVLPELNLRELNDGPERQEGVPYCISIGGGTQGLSDRILLNYYDLTDYTLPLERNFGGSFIGDIKSFSFIPCALDFSAISKMGIAF